MHAETQPGSAVSPKVESAPRGEFDQKKRVLHRLIAAAPSRNREFHASDLCRAIGQAAYDARVLDVIRQLYCSRFTAALAVHGRAVLAGEIKR